MHQEGARGAPRTRKGKTMSRYYTEVSLHTADHDTISASFESRAMTGRGIVAAAKGALAARGYDGEVTTHDIAARVNGELVYIDTYQRMGLYR